MCRATNGNLMCDRGALANDFALALDVPLATCALQLVIIVPNPEDAK